MALIDHYTLLTSGSGSGDRGASRWQLRVAGRKRRPEFPPV